jgi:hypothetical protein
MATADLVPCFYTGQDYRVERPAEVRPRAEVREYKKQKLGKFVQNGSHFLFFRKLSKRISQVCDGPIGIGNAVPFARTNSLGDRLHYEIPMAGDIGLRRHGLFRRTNKDGKIVLRSRIIRVSARSGMRYLAAVRPPTPPFASQLLAG